MTATVRRALSLAVVSATARLPSFLIPVLIGALFGAGRDTDSYFLAYNAVLFLGGTVAQGTELAIVPFAAREIGKVGGAIRSYFDLAAGYAGFVGGAVWLAGVPLLVLVTAPPLRGGLVLQAGIFTLFALAWCLASVYAGALTSQARIATATGSMIWRGVGALLGLAAAVTGLGLAAVACGLGVGEALRTWWLRHRLWKLVPPSVAGIRSTVRPLERAAAAQATASAAIGVAPVVERVIAVTLGVGVVSQLEYAMRLLIIPGVLFEGALAPLLLVRWTTHLTRTGSPPTRREILRSVVRGMLLASVLALGLVILAPVLVEVVFGHGRLERHSLTVITSLLRVLALAFVGTMGALLAERYYLASNGNRTLAILSFGRATVRIGMVVLLLRTFGILAFAVAYLVADWTYLILLVALIRPSSVPPARSVSSLEVA